MAKSRVDAGFTVVEMIAAVAIITALAVIYFIMVDSYNERRMSELSAKVLMQAAQVQEEYFAKQHRYFDADVQGNGGDTFLSAPSGEKTTVRVPSKVVLSIRSVGADKTEFVGHSFYTGSKVLHRYDSRTGKITTASRAQEETG